MKRWLLGALVMALALGMFSMASAEKKVSFSGKVFAHWFMDLSDEDQQTLESDGFDSYNTFGVSRTYLTGKAKLSDKAYGKITFDVNSSKKCFS